MVVVYLTVRPWTLQIWHPYLAIQIHSPSIPCARDNQDAPLPRAKPYPASKWSLNHNSISRITRIALNLVTNTAVVRSTVTRQILLTDPIRPMPSAEATAHLVLLAQE